MGLTATDISLLLELRGRGWRPARIATIGRLSLYLHPAQHRRLRDQFPDDPAVMAYRWGDYCEAVLLAITGGNEVTSIDASEYEGATVIHDMNRSMTDIHPALIGSFDLVIDGGSLEHVFNFPVAVANLMSLCRVGGHVMSANPANNLCGHGFYQFTPELMHRLYSERNGFLLEALLLTVCKALSVERDRRPRSFRVVDPAALGHRILIRNRHPVMIRTLARKTAERLLDSTHVQQSDYIIKWHEKQEKKSTETRSRYIVKKVFAFLPYDLQTRVLNRLHKSGLCNGKTMTAWRGAIQ